ncbi:MAG: citramalate synthase [Candidatus Gracilibacteria bacterium]|jgi:2-isopropylmalate synthase|nr:citramalate synthase [Candidatus Gracilibacteria bacterium]
MIKIYDTTLRDGAQMEGLSFTLNDKLKIAQYLADFGIDFIEGGYIGSNPKDDEFFKKAKDLNLNDSKIVAFCATHHKSIKPQDDKSFNKILELGLKHACIFGKTWDIHAEKILGITQEQNLSLIQNSVSYLADQGVEIFFDAEHFFDGYIHNPDFAIKCLKSAFEAGASNITLCDTNGGMMPSQVFKITEEVKSFFTESGISLGIHAHNDTGMAEANSIEATRAGADLIQGTINGFGERTGNTNLCVIIPNLALKMQQELNSRIDLKNLTSLANSVSETANTSSPSRAPYVGKKSFTHKAGVHASAVQKLPESYEHIDPIKIGNIRNITVSELSGKSNILINARKLGMDLDNNPELTQEILRKVKQMEEQGFAFEGADASFALLLKRMQQGYVQSFKLIDYLVLDRGSRKEVEAEVQIQTGDEIKTAIDFGNGPVNALDKALKKCLVNIFPNIKKVQLSDYKVRILDSKSATGAITRVLIESKCGQSTWITAGSGENITRASLNALTDSLEYFLLNS